MTNRSGPPAPGRALQALLDRIVAADLDPVQIASMELHLTHLLRLRKEWVPEHAFLPKAVIAGGMTSGGSTTRG